MPSQTFTSSGTFNIPAGVSVVQCQAWAKGLAGVNGTAFVAGGAGGPGGEFAAENTLSVTPSGTLTITIGTMATTVTGGGVTVSANVGSGTTGGTGSTNSVHHNGGNSGAGAGSGPGGGGGSSAGTGSAGNNGANGTSGGAGGSAPTGGAAGGHGGSSTPTNGSPGSSPGGGGGGGGFAGGSTGTGGAAGGGQVIITWTTPSSAAPFSLPGVARGKPASVRGTGRGEAGAAYVAFPSAFILPRKPARGAPAAVKGAGKGEPGAKYIHVIPPGPSPFYLPTRPAKGATAIRGTGRGQAGAAYVDFPSAFILPRHPAKGAQAAVRGAGKGKPGARYVLIQTAPFTPPRKPAKGASATRRGLGRGSITGHGAPAVPRQLIIALASHAGTDDYGNAFPQGILATAGVIEGPEIIAAGAGSLYLGYSPSPGAGNLISSVAASAGTDSYGNAYLQGTTSYQNSGVGFYTAANIDGGTVNWYQSTTEAGPWTLVNTIGFSFSGASGTIILDATHVQFGASTPMPVSLSGSIVTVPHNPNDPTYGGAGGTAWITGERLVLDNQIDNINSNFSAIITALQNAGIAT